MTTATRYNHTNRLLLSGDMDTANLKVMLVEGYTFNAGEEDMTDVSAAEVSGNGWPAGGASVANASITTVDTNAAMLDGDDISITADGGSIGPASAAVLYDDTNGNPLMYVEFSSTQEAASGVPFQVNWSENGIIRARNPS